MTWRPALSPYARVRDCPVRKRTLLIVPERIVVLSAEAAAVVALCDGSRTVPEITAAFGGADGITEFLDDVKERGWLR
ncbi:pyrroloquinoline quinone biosynthesis peptide chaperone PqqD [Streptomyces roseirectus]|uniref:Pyrroloquinoline quinone biosynthesis peptide chaperone PqqD n=1 Tax=Streptomyces roseirectus TaxID=2768066 RepID=A0A7H0IRJ4_9ACTN|nr:pyrroloquinoline quinone biosynthesis peptide chaperone PqqD [Streptomyces roseirectus]QNP75410.1 pyrroloquinoline quinone biosynthesis peptide chaperone PqqD [Streptomyces roseirectus]